MSRWTKIRDTLETAAAIVSNYFYPGTGMLGQMFNSTGSKEQLGTMWGQAAMLGSGLIGGATGQMANYGKLLEGLSGATGWAGLGQAGAIGAGEAAGTWGVSPGSLTAGDAGLAYGASPSPVGTSTSPYQYYGGFTGEPIPGNGPIDYGANQLPTSTGQNITTPNFQGQNVTAPYDVSGSELSGMMGRGGGGVPNNQFNASGVPRDGSLGAGLASASGGGAAMPWGSAGNIATMGQGVMGAMGAMQLMNASKQAGMQADPFGPYRKQYAEQLEALQRDPSRVQSLPGYQAGIDAVKRGMASQGYLGSGNMLGALSKYGGDFYNNAVNMYSGLAGAQFNPANAAQLRLGGNQAALSLAGQSMNQLGYGSYLAENPWPWAQQPKRGN